VKGLAKALDPLAEPLADLRKPPAEEDEDDHQDDQQFPDAEAEHVTTLAEKTRH